MMNAIATASRIAARRPLSADWGALLLRSSVARWNPAAAGSASTEGPSTPSPMSMTLIGSCRSASTNSDAEEEQVRAPSAFAAVDHAQSYEESLSGRHGQQLKLADDEGMGKDDAPYDPFDDPFFQALDKRLDDDWDGELEGHDASEEKGSPADEEENAPLSDDGAVDEDGDDEEEEEEYDEESEGALDRARSMYNADGSLRRPKSELAALRAGRPAGGQFAVIDLNGSQQKVTPDDLVIVNKLKPVTKWAVGKTVTLTGDDVLLVGSPRTTLVGLPGVEGAEVDVMVEEITRDAKMIVFKKRRRKHSQRKKGFRREVSFLRVLDIRFPERYEQGGSES